MENDIPPHAVIDLWFGCQGGASLTIMCNGGRLYVRIDPKDLQNAPGNQSSFLKEFQRLRDSRDEDLEAFEDWAIQPCHAFLRQLSRTQIDPESFTLQSYFDPPTTIFLKLVCAEGSLRAIPDPGISSLDKRDLTLGISPLDLAIPQNQLRDVSRVKASQLKVVPGPHPAHSEFCDFPQLVQMKGHSYVWSFQAALDDVSFNRELRTYLHFERSVHDGQIRIPKFLAVVEWDDSGLMMGFLTEYIHHKGTLRGAARDAPQRVREKWMQQIERTLSGLHSLEIVWGNVIPDNVLVDVDDNAHIIDFGGGYSPDWVDESIQDTKKGDLQGISRIRDFLEI